MKIIVAVKRADDYPNKINPYDLVAIEAALRLREEGMASRPLSKLALADRVQGDLGAENLRSYAIHDGSSTKSTQQSAARVEFEKRSIEIVAVSIGMPTPTQEILRTVLAMGADRGICVSLNSSAESMLQPLTIAKLLQAIVQQEQPGLVILGRQAVGADQGQTGQMLAALLDWPQGSFVVGIEGRGNLLEFIEVTRETDTGLQVLSLQLPAVITVELCLSEPRLITVPNIVKAKQKPLETILLEDMGADVQPRLFIRSLTPVSTQRAGVKVNNVAELLDKLRYEAKVL